MNNRDITEEDSKYLEIYDEINIAWNKEVENFIYYVNVNDNNKLFRIHIHTEEKEIVVNSKVENVIIYEKYIFYTLMREGKYVLIRCSLEGKETTLINKNLCSNTAYCAGDNKLYYCEIGKYDNYIKEINLDLGTTAVIYKPLEYVSHLHYFNKHIYYRKIPSKNKGDESLKSLSIETGKEEMVETFHHDIFIYKNYIIFRDDRSKNIFIKDLKNNKKIYEIEQCNKILGVCSGYILFTYDGFTDIDAKYVKNMLYSLNLNKKFQIIKMTDCDVCKVQIIGSYIYYKIKEKDNTIYRQKIDCTDKKIIYSRTRQFSNMKFLKKLIKKISFN